MAYLKVQKECSVHPSKPEKYLMSDEWTLGNNDHDATFTTFRTTTTYHHTYPPYLLLLSHVVHWLAGTSDEFCQLHSVASVQGVGGP